MPVRDNNNGPRRNQVPVNRKEIEQKLEEEQSNFDYILDLLGRPSRAVAGLSREVWEGSRGQGFDPIDAIKGNLTGDLKDQWSKNVAMAAGVPEDSWLARGLGFAGDFAFDPLNVATGPLGKAIKPIRKGIQALQTGAKAGKYGGIAQGAAEKAKAIRSIGSNYSGLLPEEQAVMQLFDAKAHSLDDLVKGEVIQEVKKIDELVAKIANETKREQTRGKLLAQAQAKGQQRYNELLDTAKREMVEGAGAKLVPEVTKKTGKVVQPMRVANNTLNPDMQAALVKRLENQFLNDETGDALARVSNAFGGPDRFFKKSATRWNPIFHINNLMGNVQQAAQEASSQGMRGYADVMSEFAKEYGRRAGLNLDSSVGGLNAKQLEELAKYRGVKTNTSSIYRGHEVSGKNLESTLNEIINIHSKKPKSGLQRVKAPVSRGLDKLQETVEGGSRQAAFNAFLKQELRNGTPMKEAADKAALRVTQSLFDYEDVTPLLKGIRSAPILNMPFVTWAAKNVPRQAAMAAKNPQYLSKLDAAQRIGEDEDSNVDIPGYMRERMAIKVGEKDGKSTFFKPAATSSDLNSLPINFASGELDMGKYQDMLGPITKTMSELFANRDSFTGRQIAPEGASFGDKLTSQQSLPAELKFLLNMAPEAFNALDKPTGGILSASENNRGEPQASFALKKALQYNPAFSNILRTVHQFAEPDKASDKFPLGSMLPFDTRENKSMKISRQFEEKDAADKVRASKRVQQRRNRPLRTPPMKERMKRLMNDD